MALKKAYTFLQIRNQIPKNGAYIFRSTDVDKDKTKPSRNNNTTSQHYGHNDRKGGACGDGYGWAPSTARPRNPRKHENNNELQSQMAQI